ncbi:hypothetical protein RND81_03G214200 [Saponaria officinalis]|uniref:Reticulon-like protein n=1 Tax=Saponaria officinalis TaxID=3572 RepID=A0AAW1M207_SAPOF
MAENSDSAPPSSFMEKISEKLHFHDSDDQQQHKVEDEVEKVHLKEEKIHEDHSSSSSSSSSSSDDESEKLKTTSDDSSVKTKISRLFGREKPVHQVLGGGKPADVFLWRNKKISASVLGTATAIWILFEVLQYHLLTLVCHILIFSLAVLFLWANATTFIHKSPPHIPEISLPEQPFLQAAAALRFELNRAFALLHDIFIRKDLKKFLAVRLFVCLFISKQEGSCSIVFGWRDSFSLLQVIKYKKNIFKTGFIFDGNILASLPFSFPSLYQELFCPFSQMK